MHSKHYRTLGLVTLPIVAVLLAACTVKLSYDGKQTAIGQAEKVKHCRLLGNTQVSVGKGVAEVLTDAKLADMLQIEARNFAGRIGADTVVPMSKPKDGKQLYKLYNCSVKKRK